LADGENILITGASGGVGSALIQLARVRGAIPYAVTSPGKEQALRDIGAEDVVLRGGEDLVGDVARTVGGPVDVVADLVGGEMFNDLLRILRPEGRYATAGAIGGPVVQLDLRTMYLKHLELHGSSQGTRTAFRRRVGTVAAGSCRTGTGTRWGRPMRRERSIELIDTQSGGDVSRIVTSGIEPLPGRNALEKARYLQAEGDGLRRLLLSEPYGDPAMSVDLIVEPGHPEAQAGYIIMEAMGYPMYSGS